MPDTVTSTPDTNVAAGTSALNSIHEMFRLVKRGDDILRVRPNYESKPWWSVDEAVDASDYTPRTIRDYCHKAMRTASGKLQYRFRIARAGHYRIHRVTFQRWLMTGQPQGDLA